MTPWAPGRTLPDERDRTRAATVFDRNLVVVAGAGTGKTALLVERALNLIGGAGCPVESIAAITFTEKAAAELRHRLAAGLDELRHLAEVRAVPDASDDGTEARRSYAWLRGKARPEEVAGRALRALIDLDVAPVSTIHSFCSEILHRHPREAGVDPSFLVDEGPVFESLFDREWERFLAEELGEGAGRGEVWRRVLLRPRAAKTARDLGRALASFAVPTEALVTAYARALPRELFGEEIASLRAHAVRILREVAGLDPKMRGFLEASIAFLGAFLDGGPGAMAAVESPPGLATYVEKRTAPAAGKQLAGGDREEVEGIAKRALDLIRSLARVDEGTIAALLEAITPLSARVRERLLASGHVTFDGLLRLTRDLLARHPQIRRRSASRYRTILVDEFQDTDPLQYEILFFLAESDGAAATDAYRAHLQPGRLFIVGDPKQSIYRFRGADIEAYRRAVDRVLECGGESLALKASFRSPPEILKPINALFESWMTSGPPEEALAHVPYDPLISARGPVGASGECRVEIWSVAVEANAEVRRRGEAEAIARWIAGNLDRTSGIGRRLAGKEIAILLRALTNVGLYAQALRRAGIPFIVEGGKDFYERSEVGDLISFLRAATNPNDGPALLAVMRGPLGGVPDAELARFAAAGGRLHLAGGGLADLTPFPGIRRTIALTESFRSRMPGLAADDIIRCALTDTPLAVLHAASSDGAQRVANLRKLTSLAEDLARRGMSLEETLRTIEEEFKEDRTEGESPLTDESVDSVRILSVHKAKGLEFPVVIVPDIGRAAKRSREPATQTAWTRFGGTGFLAVRLEDGPLNLAWIYHDESTKRHEAAEEKRVLYVACTRATERLILVNSATEGAAPWREALAHLGYSMDGGFPPDGVLARGRVQHRRITPARAGRVAPSGPLEPIWREAAARFESVSASAGATAAPPFRWPSGAGDARIAAGGAETLERPTTGSFRRPRRDVGRLAGIAVHAALEHWDFESAGTLRELARRESARAVDVAAWKGTPHDRLFRVVREEAERIVEQFLASPLPALLRIADVLGREVPVLYKSDDGTCWIGSCDLIYRDTEGCTVTADYKTDAFEGDAAAAAEPYRPQLQIYQEALRRALPGRAVRAEILFVRKGIVVAL
jgi:ATP-dependent helicase/nuclease subunit A